MVDGSLRRVKKERKNPSGGGGSGPISICWKIKTFNILRGWIHPQNQSMNRKGEIYDLFILFVVGPKMMGFFLSIFWGVAEKTSAANFYAGAEKCGIWGTGILLSTFLLHHTTKWYFVWDLVQGFRLFSRPTFPISRCIGISGNKTKYIFKRKT